MDRFKLLFAAALIASSLSGGLQAQDQIFPDVRSIDPYYSAVNQLYLRGITSGCSGQPLTYCPPSTLTREQMAPLIIRAIYSARTGDGENFTFTQTPWFTDVGANSPYFPYIQAMKDLGITSGCGANLYCPGVAATNGQLAVFTVRAYQLARYLFTGLNRNKIGPSNKGLDKSPRFV